MILAREITQTAHGNHRNEQIKKTVAMREVSNRLKRKNNHNAVMHHQSSKHGFGSKGYADSLGPAEFN